MKHIRQGSEKHTSGSFNITENVAGLTPAAYLSTIFTLPLSYRTKKHVPVCRGLNPGNLEKDFSKPSGGCGFGRYAAPGQALPLYMDQASLYYDIRPDLTENPYHLRVAVYSKTVRVQTSRYQRLKELQQLRFGTLGDAVLTGCNRVSLGIHQSNNATGTAQECSVHDEVLALQQIRCDLWRHLLQVVIDHTVKLSRAMPALNGQLPNGVTFNEPTPEPFLFIGLFCLSVAPSKGAPAVFTKPSLFAIGVITIFLNLRTQTVRAMFFCSWYHHPETSFIILVLWYAQNKAMTRALLAHINGIYAQNDRGNDRGKIRLVLEGYCHSEGGHVSGRLNESVMSGRTRIPHGVYLVPGVGLRMTKWGWRIYRLLPIIIFVILFELDCLFFP